MLPLLAALLGIAGGADSATAPVGQLCRAVTARNGTVEVRTEAYIPHEGDILIFTYNHVLWRMLYELAGSGPPFHAGVIVRLPDGRLATLEAGPTDNWRVYLMTLPTRFPAYEGRIWVRQLKQPLTAEESARLTEFATNQTEKSFAFGRVLLGATFFRPRGEWGRELFGTTSLDRDAWFCSELVVAAAVAAGRIERDSIPANGIYPRDLFLDQPVDFSPTWDAPLLWTAQPIRETVQQLIEGQSLEDEERDVLQGK